LNNALNVQVSLINKIKNVKVPAKRYNYRDVGVTCTNDKLERVL